MKTQKKCKHPRGMLITTYKTNIRCAQCKKLWTDEEKVRSVRLALLTEIEEGIGKDEEATTKQGIVLDAVYRNQERQRIREIITSLKEKKT